MSESRRLPWYVTFLIMFLVISVGSSLIEGFLPERQPVGTDWLRVSVAGMLGAVGGLINFMVVRLLDKRNRLK